jgi:hypothetical protein
MIVSLNIKIMLTNPSKKRKMPYIAVKIGHRQQALTQSRAPPRVLAKCSAGSQHHLSLSTSSTTAREFRKRSFAGTHIGLSLESRVKREEEQAESINTSGMDGLM